MSVDGNKELVGNGQRREGERERKSSTRPDGGEGNFWVRAKLVNVGKPQKGLESCGKLVPL